MFRSSKASAGVKDWVDSTFFDPAVDTEKPFEKTRVVHRSALDLFDGCDVRELDIELDTIPGELLDLIEQR